MRCLVTGACGFVGGYLMRHLADSGDAVLGTLNPSLAKTADSGRFPFESRELDISDPQACAKVVAEFKPEVVFHLAGLSFVPDSETDFRKALLVNVGGAQNIYRVCHLLQAGIKVVLVSSGEVYGRVQPKDLPLTELSRVDPANNYSLTKVMSEMVAHRFDQHGFVTSVIARPFNHIGPGQDSRFAASSFALQLAKIAAGESGPTIQVGNLDAKRDFSDVRDMVRAYRLAAARGQGIYNLGSAKSYSISYLLTKLIEISGVKVKVANDPARMRPSEVPEIVSDCGKAQRELGWQTEISLEQTLTDIYAYWRERVAQPRA
jgi:GDP-4-dehydro-6-deoxy-D-mannose reductase